MRVLGIDLAWGQRARTGLCAVEHATVVGSASLRSDAELDAWIQRWRDAEVLLAIDAPIVVRTLAGRRPCERVLSRAYGAQHASPHSSNRSMAAFLDGGRASALARRARVSTDPARLGVRPLRAAIEVYPHTALVSLFSLSTSLKYKAKKMRSPAERRREFERLIGHLRQFRQMEPPLDVTTSPRWVALVGELRDAASGAALDRLEDELDAYVCAYVGLYHLRWRGTERSMVVGDGRNGYIVTPVDGRQVPRIRAEARQLGVHVA